MDRLSRDFGWVPAVIISGLAYGIAPFALLGADPTSIGQIKEISIFFYSVFPAVTLMGILLALVYRMIGNLVATFFGVTLSLWALGFMRGNIGDFGCPLMTFGAYILLMSVAFIAVRLAMKKYGHKTMKIKDLKNIVE